jgi:cytochrome c biogenesis protein CcdA
MRRHTSNNDQEWSEGNAVFAMSLLQSMLVLELICSIALLVGHTPIAVPKVLVIVGYAVISMLTYFLLVRKHQWLSYKIKFEQYSKRKRFLGSFAVGIVVAAAFLGIAIVKRATRAVHS